VASEEVIVLVKGSIRFTAAGVFQLQYGASAAPGSAYTAQIGSYISLEPIGNNTFTAIN
jgi:hypothetical protein